MCAASCIAVAGNSATADTMAAMHAHLITFTERDTGTYGKARLNSVAAS